MKRTLILVFLIQLLSRLIFVFFIGFDNNYSLQSDSMWLTDFGNKVILGDFNFELDRFIASPLYPTLCGLFKIIFSNYWNILLVIFQLLIAALSGVYVYKIANLLFRNNNISLLATLMYAVFPLTLWFTHTFSQESIFQSLLIFTFYYLLKFLTTNRIKYVLYSAILFSLDYLTKSHILIFSVFIPLIFFHYYGFSKKTVLFSSIFAGISFLFSAPYGIYNLKTHNTYVISSNGGAYQFYLGNTEAGYKTVVDVPSKSSDDYSRIKYINATAGYFNGSQSYYDSILKLPQKEKQSVFFQEGIKWIKYNPAKFIKLKIYDTLFFLMPGVSWRHYDFSYWLGTFLLSLPIYVFAYVSIIKQLRNNFKMTAPMLYLFISMLLFSTIWYVQNRFRSITIEPFYIIYSAVIIMDIIKKSLFAEKAFNSISLFFHGQSQLSIAKNY
jgi:hypothetical protein